MKHIPYTCAVILFFIGIFKKDLFILAQAAVLLLIMIFFELKKLKDK